MGRQHIQDTNALEATNNFEATLIPLNGVDGDGDANAIIYDTRQLPG